MPEHIPILHLHCLLPYFSAAAIVLPQIKVDNKSGCVRRFMVIGSHAYSLHEFDKFHWFLLFSVNWWPSYAWAPFGKESTSIRALMWSASSETWHILMCVISTLLQAEEVEEEDKRATSRKQAGLGCNGNLNQPKCAALVGYYRVGLSWPHATLPDTQGRAGAAGRCLFSCLLQLQEWIVW